MEINNRRINLTHPTDVSTPRRKIGKNFRLCHPKENYFLKSLSSKIL